MIAVFAGTQEGRELIKAFKELEVPIFASTATDYGKDLIEPYPKLYVHAGAMDHMEMESWLRVVHAQIVVDATHPYAVEASRNIKLACRSLKVSLARFERPALSLEEMEKCPDYQTCINELEKSKGKILLTTGSNHLHDFVDQLGPNRLVVRVLPKSEVLKKCEDLGLKANQIIAIQGPFSKEMNRLILRDYQISHLVTKDTGRVGGLQEKIEAAVEEGIDVYCIEREKILMDNSWDSQLNLIKWIKEEMKKRREK